jgi:predicted alpha/beta-hydrolase family hydrolase
VCYIETPEGAVVEPTARYEQVRIPLREPVHGLEAVPGVLGIPEWWPTGARVGVAIAHGAQKEDPLLEFLQQQLTERKILTLRFPMPFVEADKKRQDPPAVLLNTYRSAVTMLHNDPTAAPAHLFIGGKNAGALAAAHAATARLRIDGLFLLGYPLHKQDDASVVQADRLFRVVNPILFLTGSRDRHCDLAALRKVTVRVGAPTEIRSIEEADHTFKVRKSERDPDDLQREILALLEHWIRKIVGE